MFLCTECNKDIGDVEMVYGKYKCPHCGFEYEIKHYESMPKGLIIAGTVFGESVLKPFLKEFRIIRMTERFAENQKDKDHG